MFALSGDKKQDLNLNDQIFKKVILTLGMTFLVAIVFGQPTQVTVIDGSMGGTLPAAHVHFTNPSTKETEVILTQINGIAQLADSPKFGSKIAIHVTYMGFTAVDDTIAKGEKIKIKLFESAESLEQVVVTGQFSESSPEKALHKISLISREKIEALNAVSLDQVLARELNMNISRDNVLGSSISIQGLSGENVKILVDGVPMIGRLNGSVDLSQINLNDIERIEVVEGPLSVSYGSNALAGTINLITKKETKKSFTGNAKYYGENIGTHNVDGRIGLSKGKNFGAFTFTRNFFDGWNIDDPTFGNPKPNADSSRVKLWKPRTQYLAGIKLGRKLKKGTIIYNVNGFAETISNKGNPRAPYNESAFDDKYVTYRLDNSLNLNLQLDTTHNLTVLGAYNYYERQKNAYISDLTGVSYTLNPTEGASDTTFTDLKMVRATLTGQPCSKTWRYQIGADLNHETAKGQRILDNKQSIGDYAGFLSIEWQPTYRWTVRPGMRMSYNTEYGSPFVPSLYAKFVPKPGMAIRGSVARGFRAPSVKELYMDFVDINHDIHGNTDLQAETAIHTSLNYSFTKFDVNHMFKFKTGVFYNKIKNKITLAQIDAIQYAYANVDEALSLGFNVEGEYKVGHLKTNIGFSYIGYQNNIKEAKTALPIAYSPQLTGSSTYSFKKSKTDISLFVKYTGEVPQVTLDSEDNLQQDFIAAYTLVDLTANKKFWKDRLIAGAGVKNILDVTNVATSTAGGSHGGSNGTRPIAPGRVYFIKLGVQF